MAYGTTGEVTLVSSCRMGETSGADLSYLWYKLEGAAATAPLEGATGANYTLPDNLAAGTHTYLLICTSGGYSKSAEITITVTPVSLEGAEVTVENPTYNGQKQFPAVTVKLDENTTLTKGTDFYVDATMQANAGSYTLTVNGNGNYSGKIENVEWKIEPMKIDSVMVSSAISNNNIFRFSAETFSKLRILSCNTNRTSIQVADAHHNTSHCYKRSCCKSKLFCSKDCCNRNITTTHELTICLNTDTLTQTILNQCLMSFCKSKLPRKSCILNRASRCCSCSSVIS